MKSQKDLQAKQGAIDAVKVVLTDPNATPEAREWATGSLTDLLDNHFHGKSSGGGGGSKGSGGGSGGGAQGGAQGSGKPTIGSIFKGILGGIGHAASAANPYTASNKTKEQVAGVATGRPQKLELTPDEQQTLKERQDRAEAAVQQDLAVKRQAALAQQKRVDDQQFHEDRMKEGEKQGLTGIQLAEYADPEKRTLTAERPAPKPAAGKAVQITGPEGKTFTGFQRQDADGSMQLYKLGQTQPLDPAQYVEVPKESGETGELKTREQAEKILADPASSAIEKKAAKDTLHSLETKEKGAETRTTIEQAGAQDKRDQEAAIPDTVQGIIDGTIPPDRAGLGRNAGWLKIQAQLAKKGFNLAKAELDWQAAKRYVSSVNSAQQLRIREAASTLSQMIPDVQAKYTDWKRAGGAATGIKVFNRAALQTAKNLPGKAGAAAQALDTQIADMVSELGQVYMGGNSPTDHALDLAQRNLSGDWNQEQFDAAIKLLQTNLGYRVNSIMNAGIAGETPGSPYMPQGGGGVKGSGGAGGAKVKVWNEKSQSFKDQ